MAGISAAGIGSGLDVSSIISQLMALERRPLQALQREKANQEAQLSAYGTLKSALSSYRSALDALNTASDFRLYKGVSGNEEVFTATASSDAALGTYNIQVTNLAEAHKIRTQAGYANDAEFNFGTLTIEFGAETPFTVTIDDTNNTLQGIRDAINNNADNPGVTASIINDGTNNYLTLTSNKTGAAHTIKVTVAEDGAIAGKTALSGFAYDHRGTADPSDDTGGMTQIQAFEDAIFTVDGLTVTSGSNTVSGAIQGVTINLLAEDTAGAHTLKVERDVEEIRNKVQSFVDAYNELHKTIMNLRKGDLAGDSTLLSIESRIRDVINTPASIDGVRYSYLSEVGVSIQKDGTMKLDADTMTLEDALKTDFNGVAELFGNDPAGFANRLKGLMDQLLAGDNSPIEAREDGINARIDGIDDRISSLEYRLEIIQKRYQAQFSALDSLLGQMQATSNYLAQQLTSLSRFNQ